MSFSPHSLSFPYTIFEGYDIQSQRQIYLVLYPVIALILIALTCYAFGILSFSTISKVHANGTHSEPPLVPHLLPITGDIPLTFIWDPLRYFLTSPYVSNRLHPVRWRVLLNDIYFNQGPSNVTSLFRNKHLSGFFVHWQILQNCFGLPEKALRVYEEDITGAFTEPYPGTNVEARNRIESLTYDSHHRFLLGSGYAPFCKRFECGIKKRLHSFHPGQHPEWVHCDNFHHLFQHSLLAPAVIDAIVGPALLERHPDFLANLWTLDNHIMSLVTRIPKFLAPRAHGAMHMCLAAIKDWHTWARHNSSLAAPIADPEDDDPSWGSKFIRDRQSMFAKMDGQDEDSMASQDLGFIWGSNHNTVSSVFWLAVDVFRNPAILQRVRQEVNTCLLKHDEDGPQFDMDRLQRQPYVQAVYAETLRLRTHGMILRRPPQHLTLNGWDIPECKTLVTCSTTAHMDPTVWSTQERGSHEQTKFCPDRFLAFKGDEPEFSFSGLEGSWIPFGAGVHACPGRRFVKFETTLTLALLVTMFDIAILASEDDLEMSSRRFGFGILGPKGKVPFRIRSRTV